MAIVSISCDCIVGCSGEKCDSFTSPASLVFVEVEFEGSQPAQTLQRQDPSQI